MAPPVWVMAGQPTGTRPIIPIITDPPWCLFFSRLFWFPVPLRWKSSLSISVVGKVSLPLDMDERGQKKNSTMTKQIVFLVLISIALTVSDESGNSLDAAVGDIVDKVDVASNVLEIVSGKTLSDVTPIIPVQQQQPEFNRNPYINTYQRTNQPLGSRPAYSHNGLDIIGYGGQQNHVQQNHVAPNQRPTIDSLNSYAASQGKTVTTPEELLDMCCQFPACYDPLYELCIDTCRKCETVYPVTSWLPCPPLLNIPDCTSPNLSWMVSFKICISCVYVVIML